MLKEPFWLCLLTVFFVMSMIGVGYLLRKHLPEKMEKLLSFADLEGGGDGASCNGSTRGNGYLIS